MKEKLEPSKFEREDFIPTAERCEIQHHLIEDFCAIRNMNDAEQRNICALDWVEKYADNLDDVDGELFNRYKKAETHEEKDAILDEIQTALEILNGING